MNISQVMQEEVNELSQRIFMTLETMVRGTAKNNSVIFLNVPIINFHDTEELCCISCHHGDLLYGFRGEDEFYNSQKMYFPTIEGMVSVISAIETGNYKLTTTSFQEVKFSEFYTRTRS
jgi:hypothetical protein